MNRPPNEWLVNETGAIVRNPEYKKPVFDLTATIARTEAKPVPVAKPSTISVILGKGRRYVLRKLIACLDADMKEAA